MKRELPRCDCGQNLHPRDWVHGFCPRCGNDVGHERDFTDWADRR